MPRRKESPVRSTQWRGGPFWIYLLHFDRPYAGRQQHYIGHTNNIDRRIEEHGRRQGRIGRAERMMILVMIGKLTSARTRGAAMSIEYRWKRKGAKSLCPHCCK